MFFDLIYWLNEERIFNPGFSNGQILSKYLKILAHILWNIDDRKSFCYIYVYQQCQALRSELYVLNSPLISSSAQDDFFPLAASSLDIIVYIRRGSGGSYFSLGIPGQLHRNDMSVCKHMNLQVSFTWYKHKPGYEENEEAWKVSFFPAHFLKQNFKIELCYSCGVYLTH